ncbi:MULTISPECIES: SRPBCC family protein [unclassified Streptomyces]|uniref:SRPBCC family protein n=1 Tax=unclassified Streptomyces TaxID=2593676 RepID=UPI002E2ADF10|nr:SRPBCC family protein [Streptomyces sp. NBC_01601]
MVHVRRSFTVPRPLPAVIDYLADFTHAVDWDPGTQECARKDGVGIPTEGTTWHNVSEFRGRRTELEYRLDHRGEDRLTFVGTNDTATTTDDITLRPTPEGTEITYDANIQFHGLARLADPFLRGEFERLGDEITHTMPEAIESAVPRT